MIPTLEIRHSESLLYVILFEQRSMSAAVTHVRTREPATTSSTSTPVLAVLDSLAITVRLVGASSNYTYLYILASLK